MQAGSVGRVVCIPSVSVPILLVVLNRPTVRGTSAMLNSFPKDIKPPTH